MGTRRVLVTGCSSGIGLAVAARLAKDELRRFKGQPFTLLNRKRVDNINNCSYLQPVYLLFI